MTKQTKTIDHSINGVKPINSEQLATYNASETGQNVKDANSRSHLFQKGNKAALGNKRGKQRLTTQFIDDLSAEWRTRGVEALSDLNSKDLVNAALQLLPKDVMLTLDQESVARYVINAQPMSQLEWASQHGIKTIEHEPVSQDKAEPAKSEQ